MQQVCVTEEQAITAFVNPQNGSSPMWCYGTPVVVRSGNTVFVTVPETGEGMPPTANTRLQIYMRHDGGGFEKVFVNPRYDQREPCPIALPGDGRLLVSVNPCVAPFRGAPDKSSFMWYCEPYLLGFPTQPFAAYPDIIKPAWSTPWPFTDHSYRGIATDPANREVLLFQIEGFLWKESYLGRHHYSFCDKQGSWAANGILKFPRRACYPALALRDRRACVMATSDIDEPNAEWMDYKRQVTGQEWDFDFRVLYYAESSDIVNRPFSAPLVVEDVDRTAGHIRHLDMWLTPDGDVWLLYIVKNVWKPFMRDKFFPGMRLETTMRLARVRGGALVQKVDIFRCNEQEAGRYRTNPAPNGLAVGTDSYATNDLFPDCGAFVADENGTPYIVSHLSGLSEAGQDVSGNYLTQWRDGTLQHQKLDFAQPLKLFFAATPRTGTLPSNTADLVGISQRGDDVMWYAQLRFGKTGNE